MYKEFTMKYDDMVYDVFGSASMHFCGRAEHRVFDIATSMLLIYSATNKHIMLNRQFVNKNNKIPFLFANKKDVNIIISEL